MKKPVSCRIGLHKWSDSFRIFVGSYPDGIGYGGTNGHSVFLAPCSRCAAWKQEEVFYEPDDQWIDAVPSEPLYRDAIAQLKDNRDETVVQAKQKYRTRMGER